MHSLIQNNYFTSASIVSIFVLIIFIVHVLTTHKKLIVYVKEYFLTNKPILLRLLLILLIFIPSFFVIYLYYLYRNYPWSILFLPIMYFFIKICDYIKDVGFFSPFVKGFSYFGLGIVNLFVIFNSDSKTANELVGIYFVSTMCFYECIDYFGDTLGAIKAHLNKDHKKSS